MFKIKNFFYINLLCNKQNIRNEYKNMSMNNDYLNNYNQTKKYKKSALIKKNQNK